MLNNNLILSVLISSLSATTIHMMNKNNMEYNDKNDIVKNFFVIFIVTNIFFFLKKNSKMTGGSSMMNIQSGESLLSHSSRPPF